MLLITGASGFVGRNLIAEVQRRRIKYKVFSFRDSHVDALSLDGVDCVIHLSGLAHRRGKIATDEFKKVNTANTVELALRCKAAGVKQFIYLSSLSVYGEKQNFIDETTICDPDTQYGISKFVAERELNQIASDSFRIVILRPSMIYGEGAPGNYHTLTKFVRFFPIVPIPKIDNKRNFVDIKKVTSAILSSRDLLINGTYIVVDEYPLSTTDLMVMICHKENKKYFIMKSIFSNCLIRCLPTRFRNKLGGNLLVNSAESDEKLGF